MKKIFLVLMIALFTKTLNAQLNKQVEVVLSDSIVSNLDTAYWYADYYVDYTNIILDSSISKQKNSIIEINTKRSIAEDSIKKVLTMLKLAVTNMKDVLVSPELIFDNSREYYIMRGHGYITTSYSGIKNLIDYCDSKKINLSLSIIKSNNNESSEILLRKKLLEKSRKIALPSLPSFNGKSLELLSITQTEPLSKVNYISTFEIKKLKQLIDDNIIFKTSSKLTLKFNYLIK